jgi:RecJ-like exonuclease
MTDDPRRTSLNVPRPISLQRCPVCHGQGHVQKPPWVAGDQHSWASNSTGGYVCRVCRGKGVV